MTNQNYDAFYRGVFVGKYKGSKIVAHLGWYYYNTGRIVHRASSIRRAKWEITRRLNMEE